MDKAEIDTALCMQALTDEIEELGALMPDLPEDPSPEQRAAYLARSRAIFDRQRALLPELEASARQSEQHIRKHAHHARLIVFVVIGLMVVPLALRLCSRAG